MGRSINIGIDLGTTNSAIARQDGLHAKVIADSFGPLMPSVVHVGSDGGIEVGQAAVARRASDPGNVSAEFKRLMGTSEQIAFGNGRTMSPEMLSAEVLKALIARGETETGERIEAAVVTIPAMFRLPQCEATRRAAQMAGLRHAPLLQEPIAAAIASFGSAELRDGYWLVYDLGGGTFDISLLRSRGGRLQILDHDGDNHMGGKDFDRALARHMADRIRDDGRLGAFSRGNAAHAGTFARLRLEAERVRILLSDRETESFRIVPEEEDPFELPVMRSELELLLQSTLARTVRLCREILARNRLEPAKLSRLVLVGGPTFTPYLKSYLASELDIEARHYVDPTEAVVRGAAVYAATQRLPSGFVSAVSAAPGRLAAELTHEAMTNDRRPLVAGRLLGERAAGVWQVRVVAEEGGGAAARAEVRDDGGFVLQLELAENRMNAFNLVAERDGTPVPLDHGRFVIVHGMTVAKPLLSQSVGVLLADNSVRWYLRKGAVLPTRQTVSHRSTRSLKRGQSGVAVHVPLIQGESQRGDRNTVIGEIRIAATDVSRDLPSGAEVVVTLSVDEHSATSAAAYIPALDQTFDEIISFGLDARSPEAIRDATAEQQKRLAQLAQLADTLGDAGEDGVDANVRMIDELLEEGGADERLKAGELLQRMTGMIDTMVSKDTEANLIRRLDDSWARSWQMMEPGEVDLENEIIALCNEFNAAIDRSDSDLAETKVKAVEDFEWGLIQRRPQYWYDLFEYLCVEVLKSPNAAEAHVHIDAGRAAVQRNDLSALVEACLALIGLLPEPPAVSAAILSHVA